MPAAQGQALLVVQSMVLHPRRNVPVAWAYSESADFACDRQARAVFDALVAWWDDAAGELPAYATDADGKALSVVAVSVAAELDYSLAEGYGVLGNGPEDWYDERHLVTCPLPGSEDCTRHHCLLLRAQNSLDAVYTRALSVLEQCAARLREAGALPERDAWELAVQLRLLVECIAEPLAGPWPAHQATLMRGLPALACVEQPKAAAVPGVGEW